MDTKSKTTFTFISIVLGFMIAIQFQTTQEPVVRDTRDIWEIKQDIKKEQELQTELYSEIRNVNQILNKYEENEMGSKAEALFQQKEDLKIKAGLTEVSGPGIMLTIEPLFNDTIFGQAYKTIPPGLLSRLINELNRYNADAIAIDGQRFISTTPIRDVNGVTEVNRTPLSPLPIEITVLAKNRREAEKLHNRMLVSQSIDDFAIENLQLTSKVVKSVSLPVYDDTLRIKHMVPVEPAETEKGNS